MADFTNKYPYTDFHELNLDWFLEEFKKVTDKVTTLDATVQEFTEFVTNYFDNLDVQQEINNKLNQMAADGTLQALIEPYFYAMRREVVEMVAAQDDEIATLVSRMDEFASLPPGSTAGNAELLDIRVEFDGTTAASAGDAVRAQVSMLDDRIDQVAEKGRIDYDFSSWLEAGGIGGGGQNVNTGDTRFLRFINFENTADVANAIFYGTPGGGAGAILYVCYYDSSEVFVRRDAAGAGYTIDTTQDLVRLSFYDPSAATYSLVKNWVAFPEIDNLYKDVQVTLSNKKDIEDLQTYQKTFYDILPTLEEGGINASGYEISGANYKRSIDFHDTTDKLDILYTPAPGSTDGVYVCYYDNTQTFQIRVHTYGGYKLNTAYPYYRLSFFKNGGITNTDVLNWIRWVRDDGLYNAIHAIGGDTIEVTPGTSSVVIRSKFAEYHMDRITSVPNNIDTWRLYSGIMTKGGASFTMWSNSDAEGAIKINGEPDFVSGYHGDEIMVSAEFYADGDLVDLTDVTPLTVSNLTVYVESDVYHNRASADAGVIAFKRYKKLVFAGNKVTISNCYIPVSNLVINRAAISLFQCDIDDGGVPVFTNYSVNTDYKNYAVADIGNDRPSGSSKMTEATLNVKYGNIIFRHLSGSGQNYQGNVVDMTSRLKFYFDEIVSNTAVSTGEKIMSEFEFTIA